MKVFFPVEVFYPSQAGGPANSVYWLTKELVNEGFEPVIVASDKGLANGHPTNQWIENEAGRVIHVKTRWLNFPIGQTLRSLANFRRADIVHLSSVFYPAAFATAFAAKALKKKIVWSARGELDTAALTYSRARKSPILWLIRNLIGDYPVFHSTCDEETEYIRGLLGDNAKVVQIPNFIEIPPVAERVPGNYFLFLGRLHWKKGLENLFAALAQNDAFRNSPYTLKLAGKGQPPYERKLRELVDELGLAEKVEFVGQVEGEEKHRLIASAFWTLMPSHTENFGLVVLESLAQNTPVLASTGSPWHVLETERLGIWTGNSPEELSEAITRMIRMSNEEYADYRSRGRQFVEENYDMRKNIARWVDVYRTL
ncbi:MAG TPA: glycosyltransferase [Pyrinomonadaceae bacterium]|nr:glycosyltransferase [Pyrinomonadaceae bacterium]